jgi:hypothetical protein
MPPLGSSTCASSPRFTLGPEAERLPRNVSAASSTSSDPEAAALFAAEAEARARGPRQQAFFTAEGKLCILGRYNRTVAPGIGDSPPPSPTLPFVDSDSSMDEDDCCDERGHTLCTTAAAYDLLIRYTKKSTEYDMYTSTNT